MSHPFPYSIKRHGTTLETCDSEPVQTPGCIQTHGALLAVSLKDFLITQTSENCAQWLGRGTADLIKKSLAEIFGQELATKVKNILSDASSEKAPLFVRCFKPAGASENVDLCVHSHNGVGILEFEIARKDESAVQIDFYRLVRKSLSRFQKAIGLKELSNVVAEEVWRETGLDRVMVYYFHADESGEVIAESKRADLGSWLGWRYPAHDIPKPAREIFRKIWSRPVPNVSAPLAEIVPLLNPETNQPLDMTYCSLRGASVMYTEYLSNMGVAGALTLPLIMEGQLWGLIACHHYSPINMPYRLRAAAEFLAKGASQQMQLAEEREANTYRNKLESTHQALISKMVFTPSFEVFVSGNPTLLSAMQATGAALFYDSWITIGECPALPEMAQLREWLIQKKLLPEPGSVWSTDHLAKDYPAAAAFARQGSGLLVFRFSSDPAGFVIWFRAETLQTFTWAGNPNTLPVTAGPHGTRLTPRQSFEIWREEVRERSLPWKRVEIDGAKSLARLMSDLLIGHWLRQREAEKTVIEAAERLRIAVEAANLGTWDFFPQTGDLRWSARCRELFGVEPQDEVTLEKFFSLLHSEDREPIANAIQAALEPANKERFDREFRVIEPDGAIRWVRLAGQSFRDDDNSTVRFAGTVHDVTERRKAGEKLAARGDELQALVDVRTHELSQTIGELEAFSYSVSHDLRSPLVAMQGFSQALIDEYSDRLDEKGLDYIRRIQRGSSRLDLLIKDILAFSKVSKEPVIFSPIDLKKLVGELINENPILREPLATVQNDVVDIYVEGHEALLTQILTNLLSNAVKFQHKGAKPHITVKSELRKGTVRISVEDNGIGISENDRVRLFKMFERLNPKAMYEGTGIGLAIVKKAVERMGGAMGMTPASPVGSVFWFELAVSNASSSAGV